MALPMMGGPMTAPMARGIGGPVAPTRLSAPETLMRPQPGGADGRTVLASPLADRVAGPLMQQQQQAQWAKQLTIARQMIEGVARAMMGTDPKTASELLSVLSKLTK